jgi:cytochrome c
MKHILFIAIPTLLLAASPFRALAQPGNAGNGERIYRACAACHSLEPDRNMTGPSLAELWNRESALGSETRLQIWC